MTRCSGFVFNKVIKILLPLPEFHKNHFALSLTEHMQNRVWSFPHSVGENMCREYVPSSFIHFESINGLLYFRHARISYATAIYHKDSVNCLTFFFSISYNLKHKCYNSTKFCTWTDSIAVSSCAKFCGDQIYCLQIVMCIIFINVNHSPGWLMKTPLTGLKKEFKVCVEC